ncbi:MAG TPA: RcpC/CpaB family pilus assembly protein [Acidimicrobiales bacterium]|nr:RcpC/CpaB family pilus assembly protein [Acidimicrobiales bacterium]
MPATPKKRSTILMAVGASTFVVGVGFAGMLVHRDGGSPHNARSDTPVTAPAAANAAATSAAGTASFVVPVDHQAIAVSVPFVQGLAGYAKTGDVVNVYGTFSSLPGTAEPVAKLVLQKVKVLAINPGADGGNATYVLSVSTSDAEAIEYLSTFQKVWLTLARDDQGTLIPKGFSSHNA